MVIGRVVTHLLANSAHVHLLSFALDASATLLEFSLS